MSLELVTFGINGAAAALAVGCLALIRLTANNFKQSADSSVADGEPEISAASASSKRPSRREVTLSRALLESVRGDVKLLSKLTLPNELSPSLLIDDEHLTITAANVGFSNLEVVTRSLMSYHDGARPHLFGVNRGGGLLANLLSQRLNLDQKFLVRCDYRPKWKRVLCEPRAGVKFAIVLDDVVRSGETIREVSAKLRETYPDASVYVLALLVSAVDDKGSLSKDERLFGLVDYYPWITLSPSTLLPWSNGVSEEATDYIDEDDVDQVVGRIISHGGDAIDSDEREVPRPEPSSDR